MAAKPAKPKADPKKVPLGNGLADKAKSAIANRQRSLDALVDEAVSGKKKR